jgi:predicted Zn-dependent protease
VRLASRLVALAAVLLWCGLPAAAEEPPAGPWFEEVAGGAEGGPSPRQEGDARSPAERFAAGIEAAAAGDLATALGELEAAVAAVPANLHWGAEYRQVAARAGAYDRALAVFEGLLAAHPNSSNLVLNYAYAHVDKIPAAGAITQVILANTALRHFSRALELEESWLVRYTRGNSYICDPELGR